MGEGRSSECTYVRTLERRAWGLGWGRGEDQGAEEVTVHGVDAKRDHVSSGSRLRCERAALLSQYVIRLWKTLDLGRGTWAKRALLSVRTYVHSSGERGV